MRRSMVLRMRVRAMTWLVDGVMAAAMVYAAMTGIPYLMR